MTNQEQFPKTPEAMILAALAILQRNLPPGDLDDRQAISELWGDFDNPEASRIYRQLSEDGSARHSSGVARG